jgi:molecular chaperone DnaK (HSP70)
MILRPGATINAFKVNKIQLTQNSNEACLAPALAAFHDGCWFIGDDLERRQSEIPEDKIISCFKLLLYDPHQHTKQAQRVHKQLLEAGQTLHDLLVASLDFIWKQIWSYIETELLHSVPSIHDYETMVYISVPKLVTPQATKQLKNAARAVGLPRVRFVYESLCAASCGLEEIVRKTTWFSRLPRLVGSSVPQSRCY